MTNNIKTNGTLTIYATPMTTKNGKDYTKLSARFFAKKDNGEYVTKFVPVSLKDFEKVTEKKRYSIDIFESFWTIDTYTEELKLVVTNYKATEC